VQKESGIMTVKLAITISGAVSLGAFEAGALYEVLSCLDHHNRNLELDDNNRIEVDVLTGSSAGGMSAVILAHKLLYDKEDLARPYDNALHRAWVERADLGKLLELDGDNPELSILSTNCLSRIANECIPFVSSCSTMPHPACAKTVRIGLTLSNLNGIDYSVAIYGGDVSESLAAGLSNVAATGTDALEHSRTGRFVYTRYQDELVETFTQGAYYPADWKAIREAAVVCGAFPFAFRAMELWRPRDFYTARGATGFPPTGDRYLFTDGGVFQNEPLGLAKNLVDEVDSGHTSGQERYYLYIAPCARTSSREGQPIKAGDMTVVHMGAALAKAVFNEARFQDWVLAERINQDVVLLDARARELIDLLLSHDVTGANRSLSAGEVMRVTAPVLELLYRVRKQERKWVSGEAESLDAAKARLRVQYADDIARFGNNSQMAAAWLDLVLLLEYSAQLGRKDQMRILGITAQESELAGAKFFMFQGFFDRRFRQHDYEVGRLKSRQMIRSLGKLINHGLPDNDDDLQIEANLCGFDILAAKDKKYAVLFERLFCRTFDYAARPFRRILSAQRILSRWSGLLLILMPFPFLFNLISARHVRSFGSLVSHLSRVLRSVLEAMHRLPVLLAARVRFRNGGRDE
jgi:hypothetical protein